MAAADRDELIAVLNEAKRLVRLPGNDFSWSTWDDCDEALAELDAQIEMVRLSDFSKRLDLRVLFAPTGPLQELSLSSGWAHEFLALGERFDRVQNA